MTEQEIKNKREGFKTELAQLLKKYETALTFTPEGDTVDVSITFECDQHDMDNGRFYDHTQWIADIDGLVSTFTSEDGKELLIKNL